MDIHLEQLVYGSFAFWDRGYDVLARSPGCRAEWVGDVLAACRRFGQAPSGILPASCLFAVKLPSGPWAIVGVEPQGVDDRGRPGALAFHALIVADRDYRRLGSDPFVFAKGHRRDWSIDSTLNCLPWQVEPTSPIEAPADPRAGRIAGILARKRRVVIESDVPIDRLAAEVWRLIPESTRRRASVATWAFGNANRFDLVALPRLAGVAIDRSYEVEAWGAEQSESAEAIKTPVRFGRRKRIVAAAALLLIPVAAGLAWWANRPVLPIMIPQPVEVETPMSPEDRTRVEAGLSSLAERFAGFDVGDSADSSKFLARFADRVRYRGPTLTSAEQARLLEDGDPDRDRALGWHERLKAFRDDRPIPSDFDRLTLARQLQAVARSFHLESIGPPSTIPEALDRGLSRDGPIRPTPLSLRYPCLSDYARFLGRLPRQEAGVAP